MTGTTLVVLIIVVILVVVAIVLAVMQSRRARLRRRFGPEYDRAVQESGDRAAAERELRQRERHHAELPIRRLTEEARLRYSQAWEQVQARFVDAPDQAVGEADRLVTELMAERGYPTGGFDDRLAELSVEHGHTLGHYRDAHEVHLRNERGEASTEQLRQALVHYRALFADLLGADPVPPANGTTPPAEKVGSPAEKVAPSADDHTVTDEAAPPADPVAPPADTVAPPAERAADEAAPPARNTARGRARR